MRIVKEDNPTVLSQEFEMDCKMTLRIRKSEMEKLRSRLLKVETLYLPEEAEDTESPGTNTQE